MAVVAKAEAKQGRSMLWFHIGIMFLLIIGFSVIRPIGSITPMGMKLAGIFLAMLWGWSTCGLLWPSLLGMLALTLTGLMSMKEFFVLSFGNETLVFILFIFIFTAVIDEVGLIDYIANRFISFKVLNGRPWLFSAFFLIGAYVAAAFVNMFAAIIVFWGILYIVADKFGFAKRDAYPTLMIIGVILASSVGGAVMPYKPVPLVVLKAYNQMTGVPMDFFKYICFSLPITFLIMIFYVLICRFVFRPDLKELHQISVDFADPEALKLDLRQKTAIGFLAAFIFLMIAPSILPDTWTLTWVINQIGIAGCLFVLLILMYWIHFDGQPMLDFHKMAGQINWDMFMIMCFVIPFASIFTSDATGVKTFMVEAMRPILGGRSPIVFILLALIIATVLTNIANNMVVGAVFATLIFTIGGGMGLDVMPVIAVLVVCANLALVTPAASPLAAMMFANSQWCKTSDLYKYCGLTVVIAFILTVAVGLVWANVVY